MNAENESLKLWLDSISPGTAKPLDSKYNLVTKLLAYYTSLGAASDDRIVDESGNFLVDDSGNFLTWF